MISICTPVFGTPATASVSLAYLNGWRSMSRTVELLPPTDYTNCDLVRARSRGVRTALEKGSSHLLFWDSDVGGDGVATVLQGMLALSKDFIAAPYRRKNATGALTHEKTGHVGFGFTLLSRWCMERMVEAYRETLTFGDQVGGKAYPTVALFALLLAHGTLLGEDYSFCERWMSIGGSVYLYDGPGLPLEHVGSAVYR